MSEDFVQPGLGHRTPPVEMSEGYGERATCSLCGNRRMCKTIVVGAPFGVCWMVCREHGDWLPTKDVDFEVAGV